MPNPLMSADGYRPCKTNPAESEFAQQIEAMGWAILSEVKAREIRSGYVCRQFNSGQAWNVPNIQQLYRDI